MTRLSEALKRAAAESTPPPAATETGFEQPLSAPAELRGASDWQFAPVETMHVPVEPPASAPAELRGADPAAASPEPELATAAEQPVTRQPKPIRALRFGEADRDKLILGDRVDQGLIEQYRHLAAVMHHAQKQSGVH